MEKGGESATFCVSRSQFGARLGEDVARVLQRLVQTVHQRLRVRVGTTAPGGHGEVDLLRHRVVADAVAVRHDRTERQQRVVTRWNLQKKDVRNMQVLLVVCVMTSHT